MAGCGGHATRVSPLQFASTDGGHKTALIYLADSAVTLAVKADAISQSDARDSQLSELVVTIESRNRVDELTFDSSCITVKMGETALSCEDYTVVNNYLGNYRFDGFPISYPRPARIPYSVHHFVVPKSASLVDPLLIDLSGHVKLHGEAVTVSNLVAQLPQPR